MTLLVSIYPLVDSLCSQTLFPSLGQVPDAAVEADAVGYGSDALGVSLALRRLGCDATLIDVLLNLVKDAPEGVVVVILAVASFQEGRRLQPLARLFNKVELQSFFGKGYLVSILHMDVAPAINLIIDLGTMRNKLLGNLCNVLKKGILAHMTDAGLCKLVANHQAIGAHKTVQSVVETVAGLCIVGVDKNHLTSHAVLVFLGVLGLKDDGVTNHAGIILARLDLAGSHRIPPKVLHQANHFVGRNCLILLGNVTVNGCAENRGSLGVVKGSRIEVVVSEHMVLLSSLSEGQTGFLSTDKGRLSKPSILVKSHR